MKKIFLVLALCLPLLFNTPVQAQNANISPLGANLNYSEISGNLNKISKGLLKSTPKPEDVKSDAQYVSETRAKLTEAKKEFEYNLKFIEKRIEALGEEPKDGSKEIPLIAQKRKEFNKELSSEKAKIAEADILLAKLDEIDLAIINYRNSELFDDILIRTEPVIYPSVFFDDVKLGVAFLWDIVASPVKWYQALSGQEQSLVKSRSIPVMVLIILATLFGWYLRKLIMRYFGYRDDIEHLRYGRKVGAAIATAIAYGVIPSFIIGAFMAWILAAKIMLSGFFGITLMSFLFYSLVVILARAISRVIFTPYNEKWRLINVDNEKALRTTRALYFSVTLIGIASFLLAVATKGGYSVDLISFLTVISSGIKAFCIILIAKRLFWDGSEEEGDEDDDEAVLPAGANDENKEETDNKVNTTIRFTILLSLFAVITFGAAVFGYPYLSAFIFNRFILTIIIIGAFLALRKTFYDGIHRLLLLRFWVKTFRVRRRVIRKLDFWSGLVIDPILVVMAIFAILSIWGIPTDVLSGLLYRLLTGFKVGGVEISLIAIVMGILSYFVVTALFRTMRRRLQDNVFSKLDMDDGIKHSLVAGIGFVGYVIAALVAIMIMGGDLSNFALVAGALSVGIGLGLQNIVNNFVSGIILLFERPVKVGDWVLINGEEGKIKQINIRSTEVETFNRASVIIPNATLLSTSVTNLTHGNNWMRFKVAVGVAYGSDIQRVKEILLECAAGNKKVLKKPEPYVLFQNFGSSSLDFELRGYSSNIWEGWAIPSELRFEINRRFAEEGIEIPFAQMVVHRGSEVGQETQEQFYASKKKREKNAD